MDDVGRSSSGMREDGDLAGSKREFKRKLQMHFHDLVSRGVGPNDAAALAIKFASGTAERPLDVAAFLDSVTTAQRTTQFGPVLATISGVFSSAEALDSSAEMLAERQASNGAHSETPGVSIDFPGVQRVYTALTALNNDEVDMALVSACDRLLDSLLAAATEAGGWPETGSGLLRQLLILMNNPLLMEPNHHSVLLKLMRVISSQPAASQASLQRLFQTYTREQMMHAVGLSQQFLTIHLYESHQVDSAVEAATKLLSLLHAANQVGQQVAYTEFYNDAVNNDDFNLKEDYYRWKQPDRYTFSFCQHPFIYDPSAKSKILQLESGNKMSHEFEDAVLRSIFIGATCPYLVLKVRREHLIPDTLIQVQRAISRGDLAKPLKVHFMGEDGVDEGGVQKEFFQLVIRQIFDPAFCMFSYDEDTRLFWFKASPLELTTEYELVGILIGLAIYNGHILEFRFPLVTYKKLLELSPTLADLKGVSPSVYQSFQQLLAYDGDVKEHFDLTFQVSYEVLGEVLTVDLIEDGANVSVTNANREDYVEEYTRFLLETNIAAQYNAFHKGFHRMCDGPVLQLFRPEELELLVCGSPNLDFEALERSTHYDDGYTKDSETIRRFWRVVHALCEQDKKRLLFFATGSDRVPIKGLANLPFVISRNGSDSSRLPTAHTCFNHLLLPDYSSEDCLRARLMTAIGNSEGFGLM